MHCANLGYMINISIFFNKKEEWYQWPFDLLNVRRVKGGDFNQGVVSDTGTV